MSNEIYDIEKQVHRESEGQDTITPLTNAFFIKQLKQLKHHGSNKSINSIQSSNSLTNNRISSLSESDFETNSLFGDVFNIRKKSNQHLNIPQSFMSIFHSGGSQHKISKTNVSDYYQSNNFLNESFKLSPNLPHKKYTDNLDEHNLNTTFYSNFTSNTLRNSYQNLNQTDKVFDALSNILIGKNASNQQLNQNNSNTQFNNGKILLDHEFIESVKLIVLQSEMIKKRKIDKSRFLCSLFTLLIFLFMFLLICYFLLTLKSIANNFLKLNSHFEVGNTIRNSRSNTSYFFN